MTSLTLHRRHVQGSSRAQHVGAGALLAEELVFGLRDLWRTRIVFVFTFLFPLTWLLVLGSFIGNAPIDEASGVRMMQFVTPTAAVMGVLYATLPTVASALAEARERGVLKRVHGTPLPPYVYFAGRIGATVVFALGSMVTMLVVGVLAYDVQIVWRTALATSVTMVAAIACFSACGLAVAALARSATVAQAASMSAAVILAFLSGVMTVGDMPSWSDTVASVFPLKSFQDAVQAQFDPFGSGAGWDLGALAMMGAWTVGASVLALRFFRWDAAAAGHAARGGAAGRAEAPADAGVAAARSERTTVAPTVVPRPSRGRLALAEVRWATRAALRDPGWVFFAIAMPVGLYAFMASAVPSGGAGPTGAVVHLEQAAGMIAWGAGVTAFVNMPEAVAVARDHGVLKRLRGTPLDLATYLLARLVSALWIALVTGALVLAIAVLGFGVEVAWIGLPAAVLMLLLGTSAMAAGGFVLLGMLPSSKALGAVGLAILLPLAFFSDVFMAEGTPDWMSTIGSWLPLKHMTNALATALDPGAPMLEWTSLAVLTAWLAGLGLVALRTFRWTPRS